MIDFNHAYKLFVSRINEESGLYLGCDEKYVDANGEHVRIETSM